MPRLLHHQRYTARRLARDRTATVSVIVPTRDEAATIGPIVDVLVALQRDGVVDEVLVADASTDGTARIAAAHGARVIDQRATLPEAGPVLGKGDAMWRALSAATGEVVAFVDGDTTGFGPHFALGLLGPVLTGEAAFVKGSYRRPLRLGGELRPSGGGRVTELCARPLLRRFLPELATVRQPLAGEIAAERSLLERLPFTTGYGVDVGLLIDAWRDVAADALAQADLDVRQNRHQELDALGPMADAVLAAILVRVGDAADETPVRPPLASLTPAREAAAA